MTRSPRFRRSWSQALRLGLPLGALVLLSTIFLASRTVDPGRAVALSDLDLDALAREARIGGARFAGTSASGTALTIEALSLRSVNDPQTRAPLHLVLEQPDGRLDFAGGGSATFRAQSGEITQAQDSLVLTGAVELESSTGYALAMSRLHSTLDGATWTGTGPVTGAGPAGTVSAQALALRTNPGGAGGYTLAFSGDVRLLYQPRQ